MCLQEIQAKAMALLAGILIFLLACLGSYLYGEGVGTDRERVKWQAREIKRANNVADTAIKHTGDVVAGVNKDNEIERKANVQHEAALEELRKVRAANRDLIAAAGGLRIAATACTGRGNSSTETSASSSSGGDGTFTGTIALPQQVDEDLQDTVDEADRILEQARTCQGWIRDQGFYGPKPAE